MTGATFEQSLELLKIAQEIETDVRAKAPTDGINEDSATVTVLTMALARAIALLVINRGGDASSLPSAARLGAQTLGAGIAAQFAHITSLANAPTYGGVQ